MFLAVVIALFSSHFFVAMIFFKVFANTTARFFITIYYLNVLWYVNAATIISWNHSFSDVEKKPWKLYCFF